MTAEVMPPILRLPLAPHLTRRHLLPRQERRLSLTFPRRPDRHHLLHRRDSSRSPDPVRPFLHDCFLRPPQFNFPLFNKTLDFIFIDVICVCLYYNLASGRRGSTSSDKKRASMKSARARSKSPFRSFRWPSRKPKGEPDTASAGAAAAYSDDEDNVRGAEYGKTM